VVVPADYLFQYLPPPPTPSPRRSRLCRLLCRHARYLLQQLVGSPVATLHVHTFANARGRPLSCCESLYRWSVKPRRTCRVWHPKAYGDFCLCHVYGKRSCEFSQASCHNWEEDGAEIPADSSKIGALIAHCFLFWGGDIIRAYKSAKRGKYDDRHHAHMAEHYKETPWWWFIVVLVVSFVLGLVVVTTQNITLPVWAYIVALILGMFIAPLVRSFIHFLPNTIGGEDKLTSCRAHCCIPAMAMVSQQTTCRKCLRAYSSPNDLSEICTLLLGRTTSSPMR
jgi:hypothetical protein